MFGPLGNCAWSELVAQGGRWRLLRHNSSVLQLPEVAVDGAPAPGPVLRAVPSPAEAGPPRRTRRRRTPTPTPSSEPLPTVRRRRGPLRPHGTAPWGGLASPGVRRRRHRFDGLSAGRAPRGLRHPRRAAVRRPRRPVGTRGLGHQPGRRRPGPLGARSDGVHLPAHARGLRRRLPPGARRGSRPAGLHPPVLGALRHLGRGPAGRLAGRRAHRHRRRHAIGRHGQPASRCWPRRDPPPPAPTPPPSRQTAREIAAATRTFFVVDTLEHLRRGGRIGSAAAVLGSALAVKPVLHVQDGRVVPLEKVRTTARALNRLVQRAVEAAGDGPVSVAVHHLAAPERAERLAAELRRAAAGPARAARERAGGRDRRPRRARGGRHRGRAVLAGAVRGLNERRGGTRRGAWAETARAGDVGAR